MTRKRSGVQGGNKLRRALRKLPKELREEFGDGLKKHSQILAKDIERRAARNKGDLAKAVHFRLAGDRLSSHIGYSQKRPGFKRKWKKGGFVALWAEFGTRHHKSQPFIRPAFRSRVEYIKADMRTMLNRMISRAKTWGR